MHKKFWNIRSNISKEFEKINKVKKKSLVLYKDLTFLHYHHKHYEGKKRYDEIDELL